MLNTLPDSLIASVAKLNNEQAPLQSCVHCGAVIGSCVHTDGDLAEDAVTKMQIPGETEPEDELSGDKEEVIINPEYQTFNPRKPY